MGSGRLAKAVSMTKIIFLRRDRHFLRYFIEKSDTRVLKKLMDL